MKFKVKALIGLIAYLFLQSPNTLSMGALSGFESSLRLPVGGSKPFHFGISLLKWQSFIFRYYTNSEFELLNIVKLSLGKHPNSTSTSLFWPFYFDVFTSTSLFRPLYFDLFQIWVFLLVEKQLVEGQFWSMRSKEVEVKFGLN